MEQLEAPITIREHTDVDFLILADFAQAIGGKLYLQGGGWSRFNPPAYPAPVQFGVGLGVRVPYEETEDKHHVELKMQTADGTDLWRIDADIETGRPPGSRGEPQLAILAVSGGAQLQEPGEFVLRATVDGKERKRVSFKAMPTPGNLTQSA
ncbi:MAG TPA: hypothetical protein VIC83_04095 [Candidatus Limnocylindria bacterium]